MNQSPQDFVATYGWVVISADGTQLLAQSLESYTAEASRVPFPSR